MIKFDILTLLKGSSKNKKQEVVPNAVINSYSFETSLIRRISILSICLILFPAISIQLNFSIIFHHYSTLVLLGYLHLLSKLPEFWFLYEKKMKKERRLSIYTWLFSFLSIFVLTFSGSSIFELGTMSSLAYMVPENVQNIDISSRPYTGLTGIPWQTWVNSIGTTAVLTTAVRAVVIFKPRPGGPRLDPSSLMSFLNSIRGQHILQPWIPRLRDTPYISEQAVQLALSLPAGAMFLSELQRQHPTVTIFSDIVSAPNVLFRSLVKRNIDWRTAVENRHNYEDQVLMQKVFKEAVASSSVVLNFDAKNRLVPGHVIEAMLVHEGPPKSFHFFLPISTGIEEKTDMVVISQSWLTKTTGGYKSSLPSLNNYQTFTVGEHKFQVLDKTQADLIHKHHHDLNTNSDKAMELVSFKESRDSTIPDPSLVLDLKAYTRLVDLSGEETRDSLLKYARKFNEDKTIREELRKCLSEDQLEEVENLLKKILLLARESISSDWSSVGIDLALGITIGIALDIVEAPAGEPSPNPYVK